MSATEHSTENERRTELRAALGLGALALASEFLRGVPGAIALYPLLGAFPGLALAWALLPGFSPTARWVVGLVCAPLVSSIAGWALLAAGVAPAVAARGIGWVAFALWMVLMLRFRASRSASGEPDSEASGDDPPANAVVAWLSILLVVAIAVPHVLNPWMLVKSDAWNHAGIVRQIFERGLPPQDPRFAGLHLNYVWFFNLFIGLLSYVHDGDPFLFMTVHNLCDVALIAWLSYVTAWMLWRRREAAVGATLLLCFGFNAFMYLLWPLRGIRGLADAMHGRFSLHWSPPPFHFASWKVMEDLSAPHAWIESFVDKFATGTSINYTWLLMMLLLWAFVRAMRSRDFGVLLLAALASAGMQLWHGVVGLSVVPVAGCAVLVLLLLGRWMRGLPPAARLIEFGVATLAGFLAVAPYTISISRGWDARSTGMHISPIQLQPVMTLTLLTSCALALGLAWRPLLAAIRDPKPDTSAFAAYTVGIFAFALLVALPNDNQVKFAFEAFVPLAVLGGPAFLDRVHAVRRRAGAPGLALAVVLLVLPLALTLVGFTLDPERATHPDLHPAPGERAMYEWIREHTPREMVFVDAGYRDLIMVRGRRQLYLGSASGPERAAFPAAQVYARRAVMADLYGPGRALDQDAAALAATGRPGCVVTRPNDSLSTPGVAARLATRADLFRPIYERDGFVLYAVSMTAPAPPERRP